MSSARSLKSDGTDPGFGYVYAPKVSSAVDQCVASALSGFVTSASQTDLRILIASAVCSSVG